jgi:hypothetical protein
MYARAICVHLAASAFVGLISPAHQPLIAPSEAHRAVAKVVEIEITGHYTDDAEAGNEEWTFDNWANDGTEGSHVITLWDGDSDPNVDAWHPSSFTLYARAYSPGTTLRSVTVYQFACEDDIEARDKCEPRKWCARFGCPSDRNLGTGSIVIDNLDALTPSEDWIQIDRPDIAPEGSALGISSPHGVKLRYRVRTGP